MAPRNEFRALVIGGGNCGLSIATGLKKAGIQCTVFDRDSEHDFTHNTRDWGMLLHWGTEYFEKLLPEHLQERIRETRVDPHIEFSQPVPYLKADTGEIVTTLNTPNISRVSRKKVRKFLTDGQDLDIKFQKRLQTICVQGGNIVAEFEDGSSEIGNIIIGCDGSRSVVRRFLVGEEASKLEETGHTMINSPAEGYTAEQARFLRQWHPIVQLCTNHSRLEGSSLLAALDIPEPDNPAHWKFQVYTSWSGPPYARDLQDEKIRMRFIRERLSQFCEPFRTAFLALPEDKVMPVYAANQWAPKMGWDNHGGRITLAGDAAHSMLPHRGQGLNNAIKDASDIVDAVKAAVECKATLAESITAYEDEMRIRGTKEVELSFQQMKMSESGGFKDSPLNKIGHNQGT